MLNKRLIDVLDLVAQGKTNKEIALSLNFSEIYIKKIVSVLIKKYKVKNRYGLISEYTAEKLASY